MKKAGSTRQEEIENYASGPDANENNQLIMKDMMQRYMVEQVENERYKMEDQNYYQVGDDENRATINTYQFDVRKMTTDLEHNRI